MINIDTYSFDFLNNANEKDKKRKNVLNNFMIHQDNIERDMCVH